MNTVVMKFMLVGFIVSYGLLFADARSMLIDQVVSDMNVNAWELAFGTYILFFVGGIAISIIGTPSRKFNYRDDFADIFLVTILLIFSVWFLGESSLGVIAGDVTSMYNEMQNWGWYFGFVYAIYLVSKFLVLI